MPSRRHALALRLIRKSVLRARRAVVCARPMKFVLQVTFVLVIGFLVIRWFAGDNPMVRNRTAEAIVQDWQN